MGIGNASIPNNEKIKDSININSAIINDDGKNIACITL